MAVTTGVITCSRSVLITFTIHVTKQHSVNKSFPKNATHLYRGTLDIAVLELK